jgi:uncharacterized protein YukE
LDPSQFTEGQREAIDSLRHTRNEVDSFGKNFEQVGKKISDIFGTLKGGVAGLLAGFIGGEAVNFVNGVANMDAATGRWAKTLGLSTEALSKWEYMVKQIGGSSESARATLNGLQQAINTARGPGGALSGELNFYANQAGSDFRKDDASEMLLKIRKYLADKVSEGRMTQTFASSVLSRIIPGLNSDMLNLLTETTADFNKLAAAVDKVGVASKEAAEAGKELQRTGNLMTEAWDGFARKFTIIAGAIAKATNTIVDAAPPTKKIEGGAAGILDRLFGTKIIEKGVSEPTPENQPSGGALGILKRLFGISDSNPAPSASPSEPLVSPQASGINASGGATRGDRNNNPGNIKYGLFAREHGATGFDGPFAVFPDYATGAAAQEILVKTRGYSGLTLHQFAARYAEGSPAWEKTVGNSLGIGPNDIVNNQDPKLVEAIRRAEGTGSGARGAANIRYHTNSPVSNSSSSSEVHIGNITVNAPNATDANGIASGMKVAMKRQNLISPVASGLA